MFGRLIPKEPSISGEAETPAGSDLSRRIPGEPWPHSSFEVPDSKLCACQSTRDGKLRWSGR